MPLDNTYLHISWIDLGSDHEDVGSSNIRADESRTDGGGTSFWAY